jgi:hypothetical protein
MTDISKHIADAKAALGQRKLNHALDSIVAALEVLASTTAIITPVDTKTTLMEDQEPAKEAPKAKSRRKATTDPAADA